MGAIDMYIKGISRRYPDTKAVREQIEELRDTLHLKTEELQAQGKPYDYAAREAIDSMGDLTPLLEEVSGNVRTVRINRLSRNYALSISAILYAEFITAWLMVLISRVGEIYYLTAPCCISLFILIMGLGIWLLVLVVALKRRPDRTKVVEFPYRKLMRTALLGWAGVSAFMFVINLMTPSSVWFYWFLIGAANWPLGVWLYHRQLTGGRYDAQEI